MYLKRGNYNTLDQYSLVKTGKSIQDLNSFSNCNINKLSVAADMITKAAKDNTPIVYYTDYDLDGISSACIHSIIMNRIGAKSKIIIPRRFTDGYGINKKIVEKIPSGCLLVTVDNGISAVEEMKLAKSKNVKTLVMDHHLKGDILPDVDCLIDPEAVPEGNDFLDYCGAGLSCKLTPFTLMVLVMMAILIKMVKSQ